MENKDIIALITTVSAPILVFIGGLISWLLKTRKEELQAVEQRALERRIETYNKIMNPLIIMLSNKTDEKTKNKALDEIISVDYRRAGFNLVTFGSDEMVNSYNNMMQSFYKGEATDNPKLVMRKFASFILNVRKDLYNKNTKLKEWDMLKFMITDIEKLIE